MGDLSTWAKDNSPYIRLKAEESVTGIYKGWKVVADSFNPDKQKVQYIIEVDGKNKYFNSGSTKIALIFDGIAEGESVTITAHGDNRERKYEVKGH